jgi:hypothetical protein
MKIKAKEKICQSFYRNEATEIGKCGVFLPYVRGCKRRNTKQTSSDVTTVRAVSQKTRNSGCKL